MIMVTDPLPFLSVHQFNGSKWWLTLNDVSFFVEIADRGKYEIFVPAGYRYDRSSIPWEGIISKDSLGCLGCLIHDVLYAYEGKLIASARPLDPREVSLIGYVSPYRSFTRAEADLLFRLVMEKDKVVPWKSWTAWAAVRGFARRW